jgi:hypothetical protein
MKKSILFGGVGLALFAAGLVFFANAGTSNVSANENIEIVKSEDAPVCGLGSANGKSCGCSAAGAEGVKGCTANGGSCGCSANGEAGGRGKELRGASLEEKEAARAERRASCPCQKQ